MTNAKTVPHILLLVHHKRRAPLLVEGTASLIVSAGLLQAHIGADQLHDIEPGLDFFDGGV